jgi:hypothetical protein
MLEWKTWLPATNWADVLHGQAEALSSPALRPQVPDASQSCRAIFDARVHVVAESRETLYATLNAWLRSARAVAPEGLEVRYTALRPGCRSHAFTPTIEPPRKISKRSRRAT